VYLGDAVYAEVNQYDQLKLTVEYGHGPEETIYLESYVIQAMLEYLGLEVKVKEARDGSSHGPALRASDSGSSSGTSET
jgi:hypothetical protein